MLDAAFLSPFSENAAYGIAPGENRVFYGEHCSDFTVTDIGIFLVNLQTGNHKMDFPIERLR